MSDKNIVVEFYDPSDLTDLIMVSMHCMYMFIKQFLNIHAVSLRSVKIVHVFHG